MERKMWSCITNEQFPPTARVSAFATAKDNIISN